jgi:hypothetical protein
VRFTLNCVRQHALWPGRMQRLRERLEVIAHREAGVDAAGAAL